MNTARFIAGEPAVTITPVEPGVWHALDGDRVAGSGETSTRPDGRTFLCVDAWHRHVFDQLVRAMLAALPQPLHTVVDDTDHDLLAAWQHAGLTIRRRQWTYVVPTDPPAPGGGAPPPGVTILPAGTAEAAPLRELDSAVHAEVDATGGRDAIPADLPPQPTDPANSAVAVLDGEYTGLIRTRATRVPGLERIGLVAVRATDRRRGIARALLNHTLGALRDTGVERVVAEVNEADPAATALFTGAGARRRSGTVELVRHGR